MNTLARRGAQPSTEQAEVEYEIKEEKINTKPQDERYITPQSLTSNPYAPPPSPAQMVATCELQHVQKSTMALADNATQSLSQTIQGYVEPSTV